MNTYTPYTKKELKKARKELRLVELWEEEGLVDQENRINFSINYTQMLDFNERLLSTLTTAQEADMVLQYGDIDQHAGYDDIELWDFKALKEEINQ